MADKKEKANSYEADAYLPGRHLLRRTFDNVMTEFFVTGLVLLNMLGMLVDMAVTDAGCNVYDNITMIQACITHHEEDAFVISWTNAFQYTELAFLLIFTVEIQLRLYAYGCPYFIDVLNCVDALIVIGLLILQIQLVTVLSKSGGSFNFLRIVRLVRLVRLFVVMNKVQKAQRAYKKAKHLKFGSPVERVMELLIDMKGRLEDADDVSDVSWIMHLISSDKLYTIDLKVAGGANVSSEMMSFLENNLGGGRRQSVDVQCGENHAALPSTAQGLKRLETRMLEGGESLAALVLARMDELSTLPEIRAYLHPPQSSRRFSSPYLDVPPGRNLVSKVYGWDVDVFDFAAKSAESHLVLGVHQLLEDHGLIAKLRLSKPRLLTFLRRVQDGYKAENPYHNSVHALDVVFNTNYFIRHKLVDELITPLDRLACIIASAIHDYQHPGMNNQFLQQTKHEYSLTYNDQSILESHHLASAWKLLLHDECNFLKGWSREQYLEFRDCVIQLVMGTDMKFHFEHYTKFKAKVSSNTFVAGCDREDVKFLLALIVHAADIANPAKPLNLCLKWTELVMEEFFRQGDLERKLGMPISPFYDREKTSVAQCQMGFINVLVKPLYVELCGLLGEQATHDCIGALEENLKGWEVHGNDLLLRKGVVSPTAGAADASPSTGVDGSKSSRRVSKVI